MTLNRTLSAIAVTALFVAPAFANDASQSTPSSAPAVQPAAPVSTIQNTTPPDRPLEITADQLATLEQLSEQGEHADVANTHAALSKRQRKNLSEAGVHAFNIGFLGTILGLLIAAAPL